MPASPATRAQALADGRLLPVDPALAAEAGFLWPVACTAAAWHDCVAWTDTDHAATGVLQDQTGRLWDVLMMAVFALRRARRNRHHTDPDGRSLTYTLLRIPRDLPRGMMARIEDNELDLEQVCATRLRLTAGSDDDGNPVLTITLPDEPVPGVPPARDMRPEDPTPERCWRCNATPADNRLLGLCHRCHADLTRQPQVG